MATAGLARHTGCRSPHGDSRTVPVYPDGAVTDLAVPLRRTPPRRLRTDEDTVALIRRLAVFYPDAKIAGILNRQSRRTARGMSYTASRVQSLRHHWKSPATSQADNLRKENCST